MTKNKTKNINIIALTQGANIDIFHGLLEQLPEAGLKPKNIGAVVSFARHFHSSSIIAESKHDMRYLKEWDVVQKALNTKFDAKYLREEENRLSAASIWSAIIGDRRLIYGKRSKFTQDYRVHFSDEQLWSMAQVFLEYFNKLIEDIKPDVILGFTPVTFGELLGLEIAASKNIPTLQLHSSRIQNYFGLHDVVSGTSTHFHDLMRTNKFAKETKAVASDIIEQTSKKGLVYEGANKSIAQGRSFKPFRSLLSLPNVVKGELKKAKDPILKNDHHDPGFIAPWFYTSYTQPLKERYIKKRLGFSSRMLSLKEIENLGSFCFFPLQSEPEVSLQVLGRPYHKNQIELLRNLAASLPAGMKLVVKEHPRSFGLRPYNWYRDLFNIPNLYLADVHVDSIPVVSACEFVAVISGTIGFEAIMMQKPVLLLGHPKYEDVPGQMTKKCFNLYDMPQDIRELLDTYKYSRNDIEKFICALIEGSVPIDLYSNLLKKPGRHSFQDGKVSVEDDLRKLANYTVRRIKEVCNA